MDVSYDDLLLVLNGGVSMLSGMLGLEFTTVYNVMIVSLGLIGLYVAKWTGKTIRWTAVKSWRAGKWLFADPELSELGKSILKVLESNPAELTESHDVKCGHVLFVMTGNMALSSVRATKTTITDKLTTNDKKAIQRKLDTLVKSLEKQREEKELHNALLAVKFPVASGTVTPHGVVWNNHVVHHVPLTPNNQAKANSEGAEST